MTEENTGSRRSNSQMIQKAILGIGFLVQGLRCFPWMAVNFFLKDGLNVNPSTLQILQNSANIPMVAKPIYGIISDTFYIRGQHRIPYIALGAFLQAVAWLAVVILSPTNIMVISIYLLLSNLGASISEVANDAIVAELGKQPSSSPSGGLQSFVWMASSMGGVLGNLLGGIAIDRFSPRSIFLSFGVLAGLQFVITICVKESSMNLPHKPSHGGGIKKQLSELWSALKQPEISYSIIWFAASYAVIPAFTGTMFYYQTQHLKLGTSVLGFSKVFGQGSMLFWSVLYNNRLNRVPPRTLICNIQVLMAIFMIFDALSVDGFFRKLGVPNSVYTVVFSGLLEVLFFFKILPFSVLIAKLCPPGCEGSLMAFVMSAIALAFIVSGYLGIVVASWFGVKGDDFSKLPHVIMAQAICTLVPLFWASWIHDDSKTKRRMKKEQ